MISEKFSGFITEPGSFDIPLDPSLAPLDSALEQVNHFDHLVILPCWIQHPDEFMDSDLLAIARYVGVILEIDRSEDEHHIRGAGMAWHLGDSSGVGPIVPAPLTFTNAAPSTVVDDAVTGLLYNGNILPGTITDTAAEDYTITAGHAFQSHREAMDIYLKAATLEARVNPDGTVDVAAAGRSEVYVQNPVVIACRDGWGQDPGGLIGVECNRMLVRTDATNWVSNAFFVDQATSTILDAEDSGFSFSNIHGGLLRRTLIVDSIPEEFADPGRDEADLYMRSLIALRDTLLEAEIDTDMLEMSLGTMNVGDKIWVEAVEDGFVDILQIHFRGSLRLPRLARIFEGTWPTIDGMGFYHRAGSQDPDAIADGWTDLTPIVVKEYREGQSFSRLVVKVIPPPPQGEG